MLRIGAPFLAGRRRGPRHRRYGHKDLVFVRTVRGGRPRRTTTDSCCGSRCRAKSIEAGSCARAAWSPRDLSTSLSSTMEATSGRAASEEACRRRASVDGIRGANSRVRFDRGDPNAINPTVCGTQEDKPSLTFVHSPGGSVRETGRGGSRDPSSASPGMTGVSFSMSSENHKVRSSASVAMMDTETSVGLNNASASISIETVAS